MGFKKTIVVMALALLGAFAAWVYSVGLRSPSEAAGKTRFRCPAGYHVDAAKERCERTGWRPEG